MFRLFRRALCCCVLVLLGSAAGMGGELREKFYQDFRLGRFQGGVFHKGGRGVNQHMRPEIAGLRITLPAAAKSWPQTGLLPRLQLQGDFAVTLTYELVAADTPKHGYGSGVMIFASAGKGKGSVSIARRVHPKQGHVYAVHRVIVTDKGKEQHKGSLFPTKARSGKLRLERHGELLHYLVADGKGDSFRELSQEQFGTDDIKSMRIMADPGGGRGKLEVLLKDVRFESEELPLTGTARQTRRWWLWLGVAALLGAALAGGGFFWRRRLARRRVAVASDDGKASARPSIPSAKRRS